MPCQKHQAPMRRTLWRQERVKAGAAISAAPSPLPRRPVLLVLQPQVAAALEAGIGLDLLAAHGIDGLVEQLDDVEFIEGDFGPGQMRRDSCPVAGRHIDADRGDVLATAAVGLEILGEGVHHLGIGRIPDSAACDSHPSEAGPRAWPAPFTSVHSKTTGDYYGCS